VIIAVDGPAASGKGTLARRIAQHMGFAHLDTGRLYRAVGLAVIRAGRDPADAGAAEMAAVALDPGALNDPTLAGDEAAQAASKVAAIPAVRAALLEFQREFAKNPPGGSAGAVLDGRDIGTVVCPDADIKFFVTASIRTRAARRHKELLNGGETSIYARVLQDLRERDARDSTRTIAPLKPAEDAIVLDTTDMDADAAFAAAARHIEAVSGGGVSAG